MDRTEISMLMDVYGSLLTEKQRDYLDLYYNNDLSLQEIADNEGISRQGVHDLIKRGESTLLDFEERLGFLSRQRRLENRLRSIEQQLISIACRLSENNALTNDSAEMNNNSDNSMQSQSSCGSGNNITEAIPYNPKAVMEALIEEIRMIVNTITGG